MTAQFNSPARQRGFTLIEGIITIVILGIAMVTLTSFLFPQVERSAAPYYQARAAAIGNAFLNEILSRKFDENSDPFGDSRVRCGETGPDGKTYDCTAPDEFGVWPRDNDEYERYEHPITGNVHWLLKTHIANDVDDFHGCWGDSDLCDDRYTFTQFPWRGVLENITGEEVNKKSETYKNITVSVEVSYDARFDLIDAEGTSFPHQHKRIVVEVDTGRHGKFDFVAYRSNY